MSNAYGLTPSQRDFLLIVQELTGEGVVPPTFDDLAAEMGCSKGNVHRYMTVLRDRGYVDFLPGRRRTIVVLRPIKLPHDHFAPYTWSLAPALQAGA